MSALFRIIYAAHANGTHHKLALDALSGMQRADAEDWRKVFLKHVGKYLEGSKAPDNTFKDFKNHVLHVADNYWGGAPEQVEAWYARTVAALRSEQWEEAAYAAGVLSHYFTDPVMPFHTGQTEAENNVHRAVEWSINRSYNSLRDLGLEKFADLDVTVPSGAGWIKAMTCNGAEFSHRYYEKLMAHYDLTRGVVSPEDGLDAIGRVTVAELLIYAAKGFGHILDRVIAESGAAAPPISLTLDSAIAALKIPQKWLEKRLTNAEDRKLVQAMYDELKITGRVDKSLSEDDRTIRDLHAAEVLAPKISERAEKRAERVLSSSVPMSPAVPAAARPAPRVEVAPVARPAPAATLSTAAPDTAATPPDTIPAAVPHGEGARRIYLADSDQLEAAPSIGPKMAEAFAAHGILTVGEFLARNPHDMASQLADSRFDAVTLGEWQCQARLVMSVPGLRGTHAQLLTGAGYLTADGIAAADPVALSADVLKFATSTDGRRILREGNPPDIEKIKGWVTAAKQALAA